MQPHNSLKDLKTLDNTTERTPTCNKGFARERVSGFVGNFFVNLNIRLRIKGSAKNPFPRKAPNR